MIGTTMPHSFSQVILHITFHIKTTSSLIPEEHLPAIHNYIKGIIENHGSYCYRVGGTENHVHIALDLPRTIAIADLVRHIKGSSSHWISESNMIQNFSWQTGYGAFSLSHSHLNQLINYIKNQREHHQTNSAKTEMIKLLDRYGIEYDPNTVWD